MPGAGPSLRGRWAVMGADPTRVPPPPSPPARRLLDALNADGAGAARAERAGPPPGRALPGDQQRLRAGGGRRGGRRGDPRSSSRPSLRHAPLPPSPDRWRCRGGPGGSRAPAGTAVARVRGGAGGGAWERDQWGDGASAEGAGPGGWVGWRAQDGASGAALKGGAGGGGAKRSGAYGRGGRAEGRGLEKGAAVGGARTQGGARQGAGPGGKWAGHTGSRVGWAWRGWGRDLSGAGPMGDGSEARGGASRRAGPMGGQRRRAVGGRGLVRGRGGA